MDDTVKLIVEIPKDRYTDILRIADVQIVRRMPTLEQIVAHGIPLDSNDSDYAEAQAYFAGMSYGWKQGQKDFAEKLKAEIEASKWTNRDFRFERNALASGLEKAIEIIDNIGKAESEGKAE